MRKQGPKFAVDRLHAGLGASGNLHTSFPLTEEDPLTNNVMFPNNSLLLEAN
jgi:hypothetical protein